MVSVSRGPFAAGLALAALLLVVASGACVGDEPASTPTPGEGPDGSVGADAAPAFDGSPGSQGDGATCKSCGGVCVAVDDPKFGCSATACDPCTAASNVATTKCASGKCAVATCSTGYDDLDGDPSNGCETPNPKSITPTDLALWLEADVGVTSDPSGVSLWADQSGNADNALQATAAQRPALVTGKWPQRPSLPAIAFAGTRRLAVDLSTFASTSGFTLLVAEARLGPTNGSFVGAGVYVGGPGCCTGDQGKLIAFGYTGDNRWVFERTCTVVTIDVPAPGPTDYQVRQSNVWFGPPDNHVHIAFGAQELKDDTGLPSYACVGTYPQAATMSMNGTIGSSPNDDFYKGLIGEVILYKRVLSTQQLGLLQAYLKTKWATP